MQTGGCRSRQLQPGFVWWDLPLPGKREPAKRGRPVVDRSANVHVDDVSFTALPTDCRANCPPLAVHRLHPLSFRRPRETAGSRATKPPSSVPTSQPLRAPQLPVAGLTPSNHPSHRLRLSSGLCRRASQPATPLSCALVRRAGVIGGGRDCNACTRVTAADTGTSSAASGVATGNGTGTSASTVTPATQTPSQRLL